MAATASHTRPAARRATVPTPQAAPADPIWYGYATALGGLLDATYDEACYDGRCDGEAYTAGLFASASVLLDALNVGGYTLATRTDSNGEIVVIRQCDGRMYEIDYKRI